jgi:hypothetical protein
MVHQHGLTGSIVVVVVFYASEVGATGQDIVGWFGFIVLPTNGEHVFKVH